ncbi:MAG: LysE family translocator [Alphaproteobacteria bacterium]|nr:LysE family translocator [Alphaproteobacteria bacterium]
MNFIPDTATLITYSLASIALFITPGPDMSLFLARTMSSGRGPGIASVMGANLGCIIHTFLAAFGISALVAASHTGFLILKIVGAAYLLWLAVDAIRNGSSLNVGNVAARKVTLSSSFLMGISVNLTNPKVVLFFITFLPQFVSATDPHVTAKMLFLGIYFVLINIPLSIIMILGAEKLVNWLKTRPRFMRGIDFTFAGIFAFFALKIALTQGRG